MNNNIEKALEIWHKRYEDEEHQYSEFEPSDIEYFIGCMLYNHFNFSKAVPTMKTIDLSYDFLSTCGDAEYEEVKKLIEDIKFENEKEAVDFLLKFIQESRSKYTPSELYLLNRLLNHVTLLLERYENDQEPSQVNFQTLKFK
ncbi:hypothetical protein [Sulfurimonas marina]|uniref:Uncharacterized protein n=1 Tax=Sulfurimonas marina TaxID=2590551 RepID=A0A7M1AVT9_9BACT|nr:hypothetical protein [Sulfurimonas marina]QOP41535.1 hypothetical protein FJR03_07165 [Sulfurimonas marina]